MKKARHGVRCALRLLIEWSLILMLFSTSLFMLVTNFSMVYGNLDPPLTIQKRVISQIYDSRGDVPESHGFIDVIEARILQINPSLLQFEMKVDAPVPVNPECVLIYVWLIDTDQNKDTGQGHVFVGSEFNIRLAFYDGHWQGYVDDICPPYTGGRVPVFVDNDVISTIVDINLIERAQRFNWEISADEYGSMLDIADAYATAELSSNLPNPGEVSEILPSPSFISLRDGFTRAWISVTLKDITGALIHNFSSVKFFVDHPFMVSITVSGY